MLVHLQEPEITRLSTGRLSEADTARVYRHVDECEVCLRRLIEAEYRLASVDSAEQAHVSNEHEADLHTIVH